MYKRLKIKKGDMVVVIAGDHKGQKGRVIAVDRDKDRVTVEGVNMISRHRKPSAQNPQGGIEKREAALAISNVMLIDNSGDATRVGRARGENGKLVRVSKKSGEVIK
jgi:large subunit ribosomal protein L24